MSNKKKRYYITITTSKAFDDSNDVVKYLDKLKIRKPRTFDRLGKAIKSNKAVHYEEDDELGGKVLTRYEVNEVEDIH